jgi:hypothetical protein
MRLAAGRLSAQNLFDGPGVDDLDSCGLGQPEAR